MAVADVRERLRVVVKPDRDIAGRVDHEVVHAEVPAQGGLRLEIAEPGDRAGHRRPSKHPHRANDRLIDEDLVASVGDEHADLKLSTEDRRCKHVAWNAQQ